MDDAPGIRLPPPFIFGGYLVAVLLLQWLLPLPSPASYLTGIAAAACYVLALLLGASALALFAAARANVRPDRGAGRLIVRGPYRLTRNPMYLALLMLYLAIGVPLACIWTVALAGPLAVTIERGVIKPEERYLRRKFGREYVAYRARVGRWI